MLPDFKRLQKHHNQCCGHCAHSLMAEIFLYYNWVIITVYSLISDIPPPTRARCCPLWRRARWGPKRSRVSHQKSLVVTSPPCCVFCLLTTAWHEQLLFHVVITDGRRAEDFSDAQVTKVANSGAETKPAAEETSQMPKKVWNGWLKLSFAI